MSKCTTRQKKLCVNEHCQLCFNRSLASYESKTEIGNKKIDCWDDEKNGDLTPRNFPKSSHKIAYFKCDVCNHNFEYQIQYITRKNWCPYCNGSQLCGDKNCDICFNKSFASYSSETETGKKKVDCWDDEKNGQLTSINVRKKSDRKAWYKCDKCNHNFEKIIKDVTKAKGQWCYYCNSSELCGDKNCDICFNKSFASYESKTVTGKKKVDCWDDEKNGDLKPIHITKGINEKAWFKCDKCNHNFESKISNICYLERWCPYCNSSELCGDKNCDICFNKSFASYSSNTLKGKKKVDCWDDEKNGDLKPIHITKGSTQKAWFECDVCNHNFESKILVINRGCWCPYCKNKTESIFKHWFNQQYPNIKLIYQGKFDWCKNPETARHRLYDFVDEDNKLIFEIHGRQHFIKVSNWRSPDEQMEIDRFKYDVANKNGYSIITILQEDIWFDNNDWKKKFIKAYKKYETPVDIYINFDNHDTTIKYKQYMSQE